MRLPCVMNSQGTTRTLIRFRFCWVSVNQSSQQNPNILEKKVKKLLTYIFTISYRREEMKETL